MGGEGKERRLGREFMEAFKVVAPYLVDLTPDDLSTGVTDRETFISYYPGRRLDLGIKVGERIRPDSGVYRAMASGRKVTVEIPGEVRGVPYVVTASPVFDEDGEVVGAVAAGITTEKEHLLKRLSVELEKAIGEIASATDDVVKQTEELSASNRRLSELYGKAVDEVGRSGEIISYIKEIATQSKILGVNASIEAARAREHGAGFRVVAGEIQKLADDSMSAVRRIEEIVAAIGASIGEFSKTIVELADYTQNHTSRTEETLAALEALKQMTGELTAAVDEVAAR